MIIDDFLINFVKISDTYHDTESPGGSEAS